MPNPFDQFDKSKANPFDRFDAPTPAPEDPRAHLRGGATAQLVEGMGLADEIAGAAGAVGPFIKTLWSERDLSKATSAAAEGYEASRAKEAAAVKKYREENPVAATALNITGGMLGAGKVGSGLMGTKALSALPNFARAGVVGGTEGALIGGLSAEPGKRLEGAGEGAAVGGALGVAVPALTATAKAVGHAIAKPFQSPATKALEKVGQAIARDDLTTGRISARVGAMGPQATIADAGGRNVQGLGAAAVRQPGGAGNRAQIILNQRQLGQSGRITDAAKRIIGQGDDFSTVVDDVVAVRAKEAEPLYTKAYEKTIDLSDDLVGIVKRPAFKQAFQNARTIALNEGDDIPVLIVRNEAGEEVINAGALKETRVWDYIKRGLDDVIEGAREPITGKIKTDQGRALVGLKQKMLAELDNINPDFKAARQSFAGYSESLDALQQGRNFLKGDVDLTVKQISGLNPADKEFFRIGVVQGIKDKVETASDTANAVRKIFGNQKLREKMAAVFPDRKSFREFERAMVSESRFAATRAKVLSGSQTAERLEESADMAGAAIDMATGNKVGLIKRGIEALSSRSQSPKVSREIGQALFSTDQARNAATIEELNRIMMARQLSGQGTQNVNQALIGGGLAGSRQR